MDLSQAIADAERIERENMGSTHNRSKIVTIIKVVREDEEMFFVTTETRGNTIDEIVWRSDESFEEIVIEAFGRFDTSAGVFPVLRRSEERSDVWIVTNSLNAAVLAL